jgi:hypothetical protein
MDTKKEIDDIIYGINEISLQKKNNFKPPSYSFPKCYHGLKQTVNIETRLFFVIHYYFEGKPSYCMHWKYKNDIADIFKDLSVTSENFKKHYDVVAFSFNHPNIILLQTHQLETRDDDIIFMINPHISVVLRKTENKSNLIFKGITHLPEQKNIYNNCVDDDKAWILHLILNEPNLVSKKERNIIIQHNDEKIILNKDIFYMCLYLHYSKNI